MKPERRVLLEQLDLRDKEESMASLEFLVLADKLDRPETPAAREIPDSRDLEESSDPPEWSATPDQRDTLDSGE